MRARDQVVVVIMAEACAKLLLEATYNHRRGLVKIVQCTDRITKRVGPWLRVPRQQHNAQACQAGSTSVEHCNIARITDRQDVAAPVVSDRGLYCRCCC